MRAVIQRVKRAGVSIGGVVYAGIGTGLLVLVGLFTRAAAFALCIDLIVAIWKVNWHNGLTGDHGYEFPLALATLAFALIFLGGGPIAMDHVFHGGGGGSGKR